MSSETRKKYIQYTVSLLLFGAAMWYVQREVDFAGVMGALGNINYWWVVATLPIVVVSHWIRAVRWRTMLESANSHVSTLNAFSATMVGYLLNNIIPRGGELLRPFILARRENIPVAKVVATVFVERIVDLISLLILALTTFVLFQEQIQEAFPAVSENFIPFIIIVLTCALVGVVLLLRTNIGSWALKKIVMPLSPKWYEKLESQLESFIDGFSILGEPGRYVRVFGETLLMWTLYVVPLYMIFEAFGLTESYGLGIIDANVLCVTTTLAIIVPVPGAVGTFHSAAMLTLTIIYGIPSETAVAWGVIAHAIGYVVNNLVGGICFIREQRQGVLRKNVSLDQPGVG